MLNTVIFLLKFFVFCIGLTYHAIIFKFFNKRDERDQYNYMRKLTYKYAYKLVKYSKQKLDIIGKENVPEGGILLVSNHESYFDIPYLAYCYGSVIGFIAKKELNIPVLSSWMREMKCIFIDRGDVRKSIQVINDGISNLKKGYTMAIFPEGHRSTTGEIMEFKKGSLRLGTKSGAPIVPVVIKGTRNIYENNKLPNLIKRSNVTVCFLPPIYYDKLSTEDQKNLTLIVENKIKEKYNLI
ncbi:MAG: 1-acyl-sn-glycerol-3-phosphate acyltransferase [Oscillospiraceae bacterium]|nr:1-acyl-sn-glycerol-3-phosphate acyltransferase [Oscillospiraceae bacterium]